MSDARRYAVWPEPRSRSRSLKGSRPSVPHGTNFILACYIVLLFIRAPFYILLVFCWYVFCLLVVLVKFQYLPNDWLERLLWGSLTMARGSSLKSQGRRVRMIFLVYSIISLFNCMVVLFPALRDIHCTCMAQYSLVCAESAVKQQ